VARGIIEAILASITCFNVFLLKGLIFSMKIGVDAAEELMFVVD